MSRGLGSVVAQGAHAPAGRIAAATLEREIASLVKVGRQLGMTLDGTLRAVRRHWKELDDAD
jgi:hypothetical protein